MISDLLWRRRLMGAVAPFFGRPSAKWAQAPLREIEGFTVPLRLSRELSVQRALIFSWRARINAEHHFQETLRHRWKQLTRTRLASYLGGVTVGGPNEVLYYIVRALQPERVVETGTAAGFSTAYILQALSDNSKGNLYSIDVENPDPSGYRTEDGALDRSYSPSVGALGAVIPPELRSRWRLTTGTSRERLPKLLEELGTIDIFWHDSDHSYSNMMFEFRQAWPSIREGGYLVADDAVQNAAFMDFARDVGGESFSFFSRCALRKGRLRARDAHGPLGGATSSISHD